MEWTEGDDGLRLLCIASLVACWFAVPAGAMAQQEEPSFDKLVQRAKRSFSEEKYDQAIEQLREAWRKKSHPRLLFNIARSFGQKGDCERALVYYQSFLNQDDIAAALEKRAKRALSRAGECDEYTSNHAGRLVVRSTPPGAQLKVDGESVGSTPTEVAGLTAGEHELEFKASGYRTRAVTKRLHRATDAEVDVELEEKPEETDEVDEDETDTSTTTASGGGFEPRVGPIVLAGTGVVGLVVGTVFDLVTLPNIDQRRRRVANNPEDYDKPDEKFDTLTSRRQANKTAALVGYIGGAALIAGGIAWQLVVDPPGSEGMADRGLEVRVGPYATERVGPGIQLDVRF